MGVVCSTYGRKESCIQGFSGETCGRRPRGRSWRRWEDNIKIDLRKMGWWGIDWIDLAEDRDRWRAVVNAVINLRVP